MGTRQCEEYKGRRFYNGDCTLVVDVWVYCVDEDVSGLTFEDWDPSVDTDVSQSPVATTRNGGTWRLVYARRGPRADSRYGYQEVCTLRGQRQ